MCNGTNIMSCDILVYQGKHSHYGAPQIVIIVYIGSKRLKCN